MSVIASSIAPAIADGWQRKQLVELENENAMGPELEDFLVRLEALREEWTHDMDRTPRSEVGSERQRSDPMRGWGHSRMPWNQDRWIGYRYAKNQFAIIDDETDARQAQLMSQVLIPFSHKDEDTPTRDELHKFALWQSFGGPPTEDKFTDWVDVTITDHEDRVHRRTEVWVRIPILYRNQTDSDHPSADRPYEESVVIVATTPWGVLDLSHAVVHPPNRQQTLNTARKLIEPLYDLALRRPPQDEEV